MRRFFLVAFVVVLVIVAFFTFRPQPKFPDTNTSYLGQALFQYVLNAVR
jgi:hypothetical protein